jgi:hypothetical protein
MPYVSILGPITDDPLYGQVSDEINQFYTGATNFGASSIQSLAGLLLTTGSEMSASDSSKSQIIGGSLRALESRRGSCVPPMLESDVNVETGPADPVEIAKRP